jgi:hypothetical protein
MESFTYSSARQNLSRLLDIASRRGEVKIRRRDGSSFVIRPEEQAGMKSPLDVKGVRPKGVRPEDILKAIQEGRRKG